MIPEKCPDVSFGVSGVRYPSRAEYCSVGVLPATFKIPLAMLHFASTPAVFAVDPKEDQRTPEERPLWQEVRTARSPYYTHSRIDRYNT